MDGYYPVPCHLSTCPHPEGPTEPPTYPDDEHEEMLQETEPDPAAEDQPVEDNIGQVKDFPAEVSCPSSTQPLPTYDDPNDRVSQRPKRDCRKPKVFTYDTLGTPICYNLQTLCHYPHQIAPWVHCVIPYFVPEFYGQY